MFSKNKLTDPAPKPAGEPDKAQAEPKGAPAMSSPVPSAPAPKAPVSVLSSDLTVVGNVRTAGDITVQGKVEGDIRAQLLTVGEGAVVSGEIVADDVVVNGRVIGRVRGLKVRLTSTAKVEGDIIHKTIAIEAGAHFEGSVQRHENPLADAKEALPPPAPKAPPPAAPSDQG
ncbi:polymer-forming cytoskeletal protein [Mangrovicoccus sp. HB161399]|uniref:bactofilin family protein n=1 Tax=Mangrovicoccus sp. HB161399 TaxID=2720392 RepID=UPI001552DC5D|nr:polymer-forming cytoskeletal protein [Mangrovicoccus sp. HB161399]